MTLLIISGPTASGKSNYALQMAREVKGEIINADSLQLYRDLKVLTARPTLTHEQQIPHHGYGILEPDAHFSVGKWLKWTHDQIHSIEKRNRVAIVVGGTGLYIQALQNGLTAVPDIDPIVKIDLQKQLKSHGLQDLYHDLHKYDPLGAQKISSHDTQRILRALEVVKSTGYPLSHWQAQPAMLPPKPHKTILILPDKNQIKDQAYLRIQYMLKNGALDEVKTLLKQNTSQTSPVFRALGAKAIAHYLQNQDMNLDTLLTKIQIETNQYIKRQYTWMRHQLKSDIILDQIAPSFCRKHLLKKDI